MTDVERLLSLIEGFENNTKAAKALGISLSALSAYIPNKSTGIAARSIGGRMRERMAQAEKILEESGVKLNYNKVEEKVEKYSVQDSIIRYLYDPTLPTLPVYSTPVSAGVPRIIFDGNVRKLQLHDKFVVEVNGDSMLEAGINDGDLLLMRASTFYQSGDIILARIEDQYTLKEVQNGSGFTLLNPANPDYEPIKLTDTTDWECIAVLEFIWKRYVRNKKSKE